LVGQTGLADDYDKLAEGPYCEVWLARKALKEFRKAPAKDRARAAEILNHLSEHGPEGLHDKKFKSEGRFKDAAGKDVMVYAVKSYQLRIYGGWVEGTPTSFQCPEATIKKDQKANQEQLKRVAKKLGE